jgi:hypothetical protein
MAYAVAEVDHEEEARIAKAQVTWLKPRVSALAQLQMETMGETAFVDRMVAKLAQGEAPDDGEQDYISSLRWKYRRRLPRDMAPKLPPHDPIVKEMEGRA